MMRDYMIYIVRKIMIMIDLYHGPFLTTQALTENEHNYSHDFVFSSTMLSRVHFTKTSITAWKNNRMPSKVWDGITYSFPNFSGATV